MAIRVGFDLGGTKLLAVTYGEAEPRVWRFATGAGAGPAEICAHVRTVLAEVGVEAIAGIAVPGLVDARGRVEDCDVLPGLIGWRPADDLPVAAVLNDGEAALVGAIEGEDENATVAAVGCGTGIVAALQVAGRRLRQYRPYSGELGQAPCGPSESFDELASGAALLRKTGLSADELHQRLVAGDASCRDAVRAAGESFGLALATILQLVHPEKIGLYGGTLRYAGYLDAAMATVERRSHPVLRAQCRVEVMAEAELAVARGAALEAYAKRV